MFDTEKYKELLPDTLAELEALAKRLESATAPARRSVFSRFPILFTLLTTFGVVATFLGFELLLMEWAWLRERPLVVLTIGLLVLVFTGTLYKKLG